MEIKSTLVNGSGQTLDVVYRDIDHEEEVRGADIQTGAGVVRVAGVHAYCFCEDKLVIVFNPKNGGYWTPPGGGVEKDEAVRDAVTREVAEEANMNVLAQQFIGYQDIYEPDRIVSQTRSVCIVEPHGPFVSDPDGDITEIRLIDPSEHKQYFDWGIIGDHIMKRALKMKEELKRAQSTQGA